VQFDDGKFAHFKNGDIFPDPKVSLNDLQPKTNIETMSNKLSTPPIWPKSVQDLTKSRPSLGGCTGSTGTKIVVVGDQAVGKTTLIRRFARGRIDVDYKATIGVDFECINYNILNIPFSVQLWDTAGQERFRSMSTQYYRKAKMIFIVADVSNPKSISNVETWNDHLKANVLDYSTCVKFVILTKIDLMNDQVLEKQYKKLNEVCLKINAEFWAVSSTVNKNVEELFNRGIALCFVHSCLKEIDDFYGIDNKEPISNKRKISFPISPGYSIQTNSYSSIQSTPINLSTEQSTIKPWSNCCTA